MNNQVNRDLIIESLNNVAAKMRQHRGLILTESDLKCQVYSELLCREPFSQIRPTHDTDITSIPIHTETKFFNELGFLSQAPDLVILNPGLLSIIRRINGGNLPTKGFNFEGTAVLIELKFLKSQRRACARTLDKIRDDILKGESLNRRNLDFHLIVAVFDRFDHNEESVQQVFQENRNQQNLSCVYHPCGNRFNER